MTPEQHNKWVGISHLAYGGFFILFVVIMMIFMGSIIFNAPGPSGQQPPAGFILFFFALLLFFSSIFLVPSLVAGYALLKRKRWAKVAAIVGGVMAATSFPIGTAVCVYTLWFLFSEPGKLLYDRQSTPLPPRPPMWSNELPTQTKEPQYTPPSNPPNWR